MSVMYGYVVIFCYIYIYICIMECTIISNLDIRVYLWMNYINVSVTSLEE